MSKVSLGFDLEPLTVPVDKILPSRKTPAGVLTSRKYMQIRSSIQEIGLIEPLSVGPADSKTGQTSLLATNVQQLTFSLYDRLGTNTTVLGNAKGVQVNIHLRKYVLSQIQSEDFLSARLEMRNKP